MRPERFHRIRTVLDRRQPDLTVLLERVGKSHNLSAILRNCDAVGVLEVHAVPPSRGLTLHADTSGGTAKWIPVQCHPDGLAAIRRLQADGLQVVAADPGARAMDFREIDYTKPTALMMGAELYGISEASVQAADLAIRIPMAGMARSLNVSVATALLLYEAYRQREAAGFYARSRIDPVRRTRLLFEWAYPELARSLRDRDLPYPRLDADGAILGDHAPPGGPEAP